MSFLIPAILGAVGLFGQNANNKAAQSNNDTQQASAVANAKAANLAAQNQIAGWTAQHPAPLNSVGAAPQAGAYGTGGAQRPATYQAPGGAPAGGGDGNALAASILGGGAPAQPQAQAQPQSGGMNPMVMQILAALLGHQQPQPAARTAPPGI